MPCFSPRSPEAPEYLQLEVHRCLVVPFISREIGGRSQKKSESPLLFFSKPGDCVSGLFFINLHISCALVSVSKKRVGFRNTSTCLVVVLLLR